jgi:magnesium-transporting ATPase (P-type)
MSFKFVAIIADPGYKAGADIDSPDGLVLKTGLTEVFHTFVFLQIFNYINCRKVGRQDFNVFEEFGHNFYFLGVLFGTASFQVVLGTYLHGIAGTVELVKPAEWG